jgi:GMP synthase PP-ATPase subunit
VTREQLELPRAADAILQEEVRKAGLYRELWQSFVRASWSMNLGISPSLGSGPSSSIVSEWTNGG